jgi:hypothetical protein
MAKPETVRYEVQCQKEPVATYERKFNPAMQFTKGKEAPLDPVGDAIVALEPYKKIGRVLGKEMEGGQMTVQMQAYPLNRATFNAGAKVRGQAPAVEITGLVLGSTWSVEKKQWLYQVGPDEGASPTETSQEWVPEDLLKSVE